MKDYHTKRYIEKALFSRRKKRVIREYTKQTENFEKDS